MKILYLDLDTLRPDHLGCYGYARNTSPTIDRIAAQGVRFDHYYCSDAPCLPSRTAMMSGRFGIHSGVVNHGGQNADRRPERGGSLRDTLSSDSLPAFLKQQGMHTAFIGGFAERHASFTFYAGFREIHDTGMNGMESAEHVTPTVMEWIEKNAASKDNWYLHVNYWDPHTPYRAPESFGNPFATEPLPAWYSEEVIQAHRQLPGPHGAQEISMYNNVVSPAFPRHPGEVKDMDDMRRMIDGYDCGIAYLDGHIRQILEALAAQGVGEEELAIIVSADHGENLGELGLYAEHATADEITCRIPMIVRWPGGLKGAVDQGLHYNLDLLPTLADLFKQERKPSWDGQSYAAAITEGAGVGRDYLVISQCAHVCQRGVRWGDWLYMRTWHDGFHLFPEEMLFNLADDPYEQHDLAAGQPALCAEARAKLAAWHGQMMATMPAGYDTDPLDEVLAEGGPFHARGHLKRYCARLEQTGRAHTIAELKRRHPREFE